MSASKFRGLALFAFGAAFLCSATARGQQDAALAEELFDRGRLAVERGDYALASSEFEASYRAEPAVGTLLNLAVCEEKLGSWIAAFQHLGQGLGQMSADDRRRPSVTARLNELGTRIPRLTIRSAGDLPPAVVVFLDAQPVDPASLGSPMAIDPGPHVLRCEGAHVEVCRHAFEAREGDSLSWWIELAAKPETAVPAPPAAPHLPIATAGGSGSSRHALALWTGGAALASLALGLVAGGEVLAQKNAMAPHCDSTGCDATGVAAASSGRAWSWVSTIATGVGVLGLGTAIVFGVTAPSAKGAGAAIAARGSF